MKACVLCDPIVSRGGGYVMIFAGGRKGESGNTIAVVEESETMLAASSGSREATST